MSKSSENAATKRVERHKVKLERMRTVLAMKAKGSTLQEMGDELGLTRERARQILLDAESWKSAGQL